MPTPFWDKHLPIPQTLSVFGIRLTVSHPPLYSTASLCFWNTNGTTQPKLSPTVLIDMFKYYHHYPKFVLEPHLFTYLWEKREHLTLPWCNYYLVSPCLLFPSVDENTQAYKYVNVWRKDMGFICHIWDCILNPKQQSAYSMCLISVCSLISFPPSLFIVILSRKTATHLSLLRTFLALISSLLQQAVLVKFMAYL